MRDDGAFKAFEAAGWSDRARTYTLLMAQATAHATDALLDGVERGTRLLDVGSGLGDLCAAAAQRGASTHRHRPRAGDGPHRTGAAPRPGVPRGRRRAAAVRGPGVRRGDRRVRDQPPAAPERAVAELRRVARRVSLAMWAEATPLFALPTEAAGDAPIAGPDGERFASRENLLGLLPGEITELTFVLELPSFDALWDGLLGGTVRTAARLHDGVRPKLARLAEPYRRGAGYALPTTVRVVTACSGRSGP